MKRHPFCVIAFIVIFPFFITISTSNAFDLNDAVSVGAAFLTNLAVHEAGHAVVASNLGAEKVSVKFFGKEKNNLFLGYTDVQNIAEESLLPMQLGGEIAANVNFEYSLKQYRNTPSTYNRSLMLFSGTDFLFYSIYSFYLSEGSHASDPIIIARETGFRKSTILGVALIQTIANTYRVANNSDKVIPILGYKKDSIFFSLKISI